MKKQAKKNYPCLAKQLKKITILKTKIILLHKNFFLSPSKIRRCERIAKDITINGKYEDRRNKKTTKKPIWKINERFK